MKIQVATATKVIHATAASVYEIIADYRTKHLRILPKPYFLTLDVEEGGYGEGTIVNFTMRILGQTQSFRSLITEPEPGHVLLETDINSGVATRFQVVPEDKGTTQVNISTELKNRGMVEGFIAKQMLKKIYRQELELLAHLAEDQASVVPSATLDKAR